MISHSLSDSELEKLENAVVFLQEMYVSGALHDPAFESLGVDHDQLARIVLDANELLALPRRSVRGYPTIETLQKLAPIAKKPLPPAAQAEIDALKADIAARG